MRTRFWIETALSALFAALLLLTLIWKDWIEGLTGLDPDRHSGSLEAVLTTALLTLTLISAHIARSEHRQHPRNRLQPSLREAAHGAN